MVTVKLQKKIMTDFAHFPRPGENDPYIYAIAPQGEWVQPDVRLDVKEAYDGE